MKTTIILIAIMFYSCVCMCQSNAELVKENLPEMYASIKSAAEIEWKQDYSMVKYEINKQCDAFIKFMEYYDKYDEGVDETKMNIVLNAYLEWTGENTTDWSMVVYTIEKQLKAYQSY